LTENIHHLLHVTETLIWGLRWEITQNYRNKDKNKIWWKCNWILFY